MFFFGRELSIITMIFNYWAEEKHGNNCILILRGIDNITRKTDMVVMYEEGLRTKILIIKFDAEEQKYIWLAASL